MQLFEKFFARTLCASMILALAVPSLQLNADSPTPNRLINEKSPYLQQHVYNPVDWYPWGEEAFQKARQEEKPIFLSVGYSTCHWCHVMNRESFSDPEIAEYLNEHFVSIKLDREERPDIDRIYMTFVQASTGEGGWPLNVWMTPDLQPFLGGTYFPPRPQGGQQGFLPLLKRVVHEWSENRAPLVQHAGTVTGRLREFISKGAEEASPSGIDGAPFQDGYARFDERFDERHGGFGGAPKFPQPGALKYLFRVHAAEGKDSLRGERALEMALVTLRKIAAGGIHDSVGGGFHRYSVDASWRVPHFEKMLYDQAQLAVSYIEAYQITGDSFFREVAEKTLDYVLSDLTDEHGGFYSAEDAESLPAEEASNTVEGAYYVWEKRELDAILEEGDAELFQFFYNITSSGNVQPGADTRGQFRRKNVLAQNASVAEAATRFEKTEAEVAESLEQSRELLLAAREQRPRPHLDDKIIASWNGLMISAFARGYQVFEKPEYLDAAAGAASFIRNEMYDASSGTLFRIYRNGPGEVKGFADDYAFLVQGAIDLYEASLDIGWLQWGVELQEHQDALFFDDEEGGYFHARQDVSDVLFHLKDIQDGVKPSANAIAILNLLRIFQMTGQESWHEQAEATLAAFQPRLESQGGAVPQMLIALQFFLEKHQQVVIAGKPSAADTKAMLRVVHRKFLPNKIILLADEGEGQEYLSRTLEFIVGVKQLDERATVYFCENYVCQLPTNDPMVLARLIQGALE